jgi:DNA-binding GntR family transcriptional regulator
VHPSLVDEAVQVLREDIVAGSIPSSGRIRLAAVADRLNMSPIPVREALRILMQEGLVELVPRRGYRVRPVSLEDLADTYLVRKQLDSLAVRQAVGRIETGQIDHLEDVLVSLGQAAEANDQAQRRILHHELHFGLYQAAGSPWLMRLLSTLWENSDRYQRLSSSVRGSASDFVEEHGRILRAVRDGDPEGAEARMREHLQRTEDSVRGVLQARFGESDLNHADLRPVAEITR